MTLTKEESLVTYLVTGSLLGEGQETPVSPLGLWPHCLGPVTFISISISLPPPASSHGPEEAKSVLVPGDGPENGGHPLSMLKMTGFLPNIAVSCVPLGASIMLPRTTRETL